MNLPNMISLARLLAVPVVVWLVLDDEMLAAFWLFVAAGVSDAVDGFIAKRFNAGSVLGAFLDPIADKALLVGIYVTLGYKGDLENWLVIMIVFRDLLIVGGALLFHTITQNLTMDPLAVSKVNTALQLVLAGVLLAAGGYGLDFGWFRDALVYTVAATTLVSGAAYIVTWTRRASDLEEGERS
jgi:cardiolipin synthase